MMKKQSKINQKDRVGILAGSGVLPSLIADELGQKQIFHHIFLLGPNQMLAGRPNCTSLAITAVDDCLEQLKKLEINKIVFVGHVTRPSFSELKINGEGAKLLKQILFNKFRGDNSLLTIINSFFEAKGFTIVSADNILGSLLAPAGVIAGNKPSKLELAVMVEAFQKAKKLGEADIGQAIIVKDGYVTSVEAAEGTDNMLKRNSQLPQALQGGMLIKICKPQQDKRVDLPTIGPETIVNAAKAGINLIVVEAGKTNLLLRDEVIKIAKEHKVNIYGLKVDP